MTNKRFNVVVSGYCWIEETAKVTGHNGEGKYYMMSECDANNLCTILNELHEENQKQKTTIRMLEQQSQRQINRNDRLHKDWDRLYQHLLDMGLMTHEEILKVIE